MERVENMQANTNRNDALVITVFVVLVLMGIAGIATVLYFNVSGKELSFSKETCAFPLYFHIYCPGCGGTRAIRYLMRGDVIRSFMAHPIVLYLLILYIQSVCVSIYTIFIKKDMVVRYYVRIWELWVLLGIVVGSFLIRNLLLIFFGIDFLGECAPFW